MSVKFYTPVRSVLKKSIRSWHNRILSLGLCLVCIYVTARLITVLQDSLDGSAGGLLIIATGIGIYRIWQQRRVLQRVYASEEDRLLGYILVLSGVILYPFCSFALWAQAIDCVVVLFGLACSHWGLGFFQKFSFSALLIAVGILPKTTLFLQVTYETFLPSNLLENLMAWGGSKGLQLIGQAAVSQGPLITIGDRSVLVAYGCNGLYMAVTMAVASLVLGLFLKQGKKAILIMILVGVVLALLTNVPRIMVMTLASVYWGDRWFHFWHDSWGGQIFVSGLFTIYYYAVMAITNRRDRSAESV